jgi:hypothetical protein
VDPRAGQAAADVRDHEDEEDDGVRDVAALLVGGQQGTDEEDGGPVVPTRRREPHPRPGRRCSRRAAPGCRLVTSTPPETTKRLASRAMNEGSPSRVPQRGRIVAHVEDEPGSPAPRPRELAQVRRQNVGTRRGRIAMASSIAAKGRIQPAAARADSGFIGGSCVLVQKDGSIRVSPSREPGGSARCRTDRGVFPVTESMTSRASDTVLTAFKRRT